MKGGSGNVTNQIDTKTETNVHHPGRNADTVKRDHVHVFAIELSPDHKDTVLQSRRCIYATVVPPLSAVFGTLITAALLGMLFVYVFILPSKMAFFQQQAVKDDRSPTHNLLIEVK